MNNQNEFDLQKKILRISILEAGPRYSQSTNIDLDIAFAFQGLVNSKLFQDYILTCIRNIQKKFISLENSKSIALPTNTINLHQLFIMKIRAFLASNNRHNLMQEILVDLDKLLELTEPFLN